MDISLINISQRLPTTHTQRPHAFGDFVGQEHIKKVLQTAITSAQTSGAAL